MYFLSWKNSQGIFWKKNEGELQLVLENAGKEVSLMRNGCSARKAVSCSYIRITYCSSQLYHCSLVKSSSSMLYYLYLSRNLGLKFCWHSGNGILIALSSNSQTQMSHLGESSTVHFQNPHWPPQKKKRKQMECKRLKLRKQDRDRYLMSVSTGWRLLVKLFILLLQ